MVREFLVASTDESLSDWEPLIVLADNKEGAIDRYLRIEYSKDPVFRENVLNLSINGSFIEKFFVMSEAENLRFETIGQVEYDLDAVKSRIRVFFSQRPDVGERFLRYMDTRDESCIDEEVFEFISAADVSGIVALDLEKIRRL